MGQPWSENSESTQGPQLEAGPSPQPRSLPTRQRLVVGIVGLVVVILAAGIIGFVLGRSSGGDSQSPIEAAESQTRLKGAYDTCRRRDADQTLELTDSGATIVIDTGSKYGSTAGMDCVLEELGTPQSIIAQMGRTTAMMGV